MYTTVEPCFMCAGALMHARVERVVWAVRDPKFGGCRSLGEVLTHPGGEPQGPDHRGRACRRGTRAPSDVLSKQAHGDRLTGPLTGEASDTLPPRPPSGPGRLRNSNKRRGAGAAERTGFENQRVPCVRRGFQIPPLRHSRVPRRAAHQRTSAPPSRGAGREPNPDGEVSEWLKEHAWKACVSATAPRVRIPPSPPSAASRVMTTERETRARRRVRSHAVGRVRTGSGRERSSPKDLDPSARCPGPPAGSSPFDPGRIGVGPGPARLVRVPRASSRRSDCRGAVGAVSLPGRCPTSFSHASTGRRPSPRWSVRRS